MEEKNEDLSWLNLPEAESTEAMIDTFAVETLLQNRGTETASRRLSGILGDLGVSISPVELKSKLTNLSDSDVTSLTESLKTEPVVVFKEKLLKMLDISDNIAA